MSNSLTEESPIAGDAAPLEAVPLESVPDVPAADPIAAEITRLRAEIDEVDAEIIAIVQRRISLSQQIQAIRIAHGGRRLAHSRELKIVSGYVEALGRGGSQLALTLLELCRGRA